MARYCKYSLWADCNILRSSTKLDQLKIDMFKLALDRKYVSVGIIDNTINEFVYFL